MPSLIAVLGLDANPFRSGLMQAQSHATKAGRSIGSAITGQLAGFLSVAGVTALTRNTIQWAGKLRDVADAQRVNVEWLQKMVNGAELYGGSLEDVEKVLDKLNQVRQDPSKDQAAAMDRLGLGNSSGLSAAGFFEKLSEKISKGFDAQSAADLEEIGGKSARNLMAAFSEQFANDTPILSEELVDQLDDIGDKFTSLATMMKVSLAPSIVWVADIIYATVKKIQQIAAFLGGWLGTGDASFGVDAAAQTMLEQDANDESIRNGTSRARAARRKRENSGLQISNIELGDKEKKSKQDTKLDLNTLQQVGAYTAQDPSRREALALIKSIAQDVKIVSVGVQRVGVLPGSETRF